MQAKKINKSSWVIRLQRGEKIIKTLKNFCKEKDIYGGFFFGVGAMDQVEIAHYSLEKKKYSSKKLKKAFEVLNITGSIGREKDLIVHAHVTLGDNKMKVLGGHLVEGRVSGTMELYLIKLPTLEKKYDSETGLKLFDL